MGILISVILCCLVGDQIFTDLLGARLSGMRAVLLEPVELESGKLLQWKRRWEKRLRKRYQALR